jgi:hypothetical protein
MQLITLTLLLLLVAHIQQDVHAIHGLTPLNIYLRGGQDTSTLTANDDDSLSQSAPISIMVSTSFGSSFLDKKKRLSLSRNTTISQLKSIIEQKFPANPPEQLQRLFYGLRHLRDEDILGNISSSSSAQILLDMPSGTSVYNKSMNLAQALEAYASLIIQQTYLGEKLKAVYTNTLTQLPSNDASEIQPDSILYRDMFMSVNESIYTDYYTDIIDALEIEKEPDTLTDDTAAWRGVAKQRSPFVVAFAKEFDINLRSFKSFIYFSGLLIVSTPRTRYEHIPALKIQYYHHYSFNCIHSFLASIVLLVLRNQQ